MAIDRSNVKLKSPYRDWMPASWLSVPVLPSPSLIPNPIESLRFVNPTHPNATDSDNPWGSPSRPRITLPIPAAIGPGVTIVLDGRFGPHQAMGGMIKLRGEGTIHKPVRFLMQPNFSTTKGLLIEGSYTATYGGRVALGRNAGPNCGAIVRGAALLVRDLSVADGPAATTASISLQSVPNYQSRDLRIVNCRVADCGSPMTDGRFPDRDEDHHAFHIGADVWNVLIDQCQATRVTGNGIQINPGLAIKCHSTHSIDIRNCRFSKTKQAGIWSKFGKDIDVVNCEVSDIEPYTHTPQGDGMGCQYGTTNMRFIGNVIRNCGTGIRVASNGGPGGNGPAGAITIDRCVFNNIRHADAARNRWAGGWAISSYDNPDVTATRNTFTDVDGEISVPQPPAR